MLRAIFLIGAVLLGCAVPAYAQGIRYTPPAADTTARTAAAAAQSDADAAQLDATSALNFARTLTFWPRLTAGAEAANARAVTIAVEDRNGDAPTGTVQLFCQLRDGSMLPELATAFTMAETGLGSENSTSGKPAMLVTTDATGHATLTVTDVAGASALTTYLFCSPVTSHGATAVVALTFDNA